MGKQFDNVTSIYGAPMGRPTVSDGAPCNRVVSLFKVLLNDGGYDDGGAYWGLQRRGQSLYCARIGRNGLVYQQFVSAANRKEAAEMLGISLCLIRS